MTKRYKSITSSIASESSFCLLVLCIFSLQFNITPRGGDTPDDGLYRGVPPSRGTFLRLQVYERVGMSLVEIYQRVRKSVISVCKKAQ